MTDYQKEKFAKSLGKTVKELNAALEDMYNYEYERLKEFGIRVEKIHDHRICTFKGNERLIHAFNMDGYISELADNI